MTPAVAAEDAASEERPASMPPPLTFEQGPPPAAGATWRCASCYNSRFKTMCFGENQSPAADVCKFCGQAQADAGWTIWRRYDELPARVQRRIDRTNSKVLTVLRTRWPDAAVAALRPDDGTEAELGADGVDPARYPAPAV